MSKTKLPEYDYDTVIIGGGPAGYTAGIYAARAGLKAMLVEGAATVSQITITDLIENYPGIPDGINGLDLMQLFKNQALKFGLEVITKDVSAVKKSDVASVIWNVTAGDKSFKTLSVIAATGAQWRKLGVPGEEEFAGKGVSYCATCDGPFYKNKDVVVVGGGVGIAPIFPIARGLKDAGLTSKRPTRSTRRQQNRTMTRGIFARCSWRSFGVACYCSPIRGKSCLARLLASGQRGTLLSS